MNCDDFRHTALSEPASRDAGFLEHRLGCADCREFVELLQRRDAALAAALSLPVPSGLQERLLARVAAQSTKDAPAAVETRPRVRLAAAAALLIGAGIAALLWLPDGGSEDSVRPAPAVLQNSLGVEVIQHIEHEPALLTRDASPIATRKVNEVLRKVDALLIEQPGVAVTYAGMCRFRGNLVPHLVMQGETGPITLMLLPDEQVSGPMSIEEGDFRGTLFPSGDGGSVAIVGGSEEDIPAVQERILNSVEWSI